MILVHFDLGPDFKHRDHDCECDPFLIDSEDFDSTDEIMERIRHEQEIRRKN